MNPRISMINHNCTARNQARLQSIGTMAITRSVIGEIRPTNASITSSITLRLNVTADTAGAAATQSRNRSESVNGIHDLVFFCATAGISAGFVPITELAICAINSGQL